MHRIVKCIVWTWLKLKQWRSHRVVKQFVHVCLRSWFLQNAIFKIQITINTQIMLRYFIWKSRYQDSWNDWLFEIIFHLYSKWNLPKPLTIVRITFSFCSRKDIRRGQRGYKETRGNRSRIVRTFAGGKIERCSPVGVRE